MYHYYVCTYTHTYTFHPRISICHEHDNYTTPNLNQANIWHFNPQHNSNNHLSSPNPRNQTSSRTVCHTCMCVCVVYVCVCLCVCTHTQTYTRISNTHTHKHTQISPKDIHLSYAHQLHNKFESNHERAFQSTTKAPQPFSTNKHKKSIEFSN